MPAARFVVRGRVQGVGFRMFVLDTAEVLGLSGEVWNRRDGGVEALVSCLDATTVDVFERALHKGPGWVDTVEREPAPDPGLDHFRVGPTR